MNLKLKFFQQQVLTSLGLIGLVAAISLSITNDNMWVLIVSFLYSQIVVSLIGTQIVLHRYFSHRSFNISPVVKALFLFLSFPPGQGSPIAWAAAHRHHHKHSDKELDNHSPRESYFLAAGGWLLKGYKWVVEVKKLKTIPTDLLRDATLVKLDKYYYSIWWAIILVSFAINYTFAIYFILAPVGWNLLLSALVTLGCHMKLPFGYRNYDLDDNTHNNLFVQLVILGDALHNNHHKYPNNFDTKTFKFEFDLAGKIISLINVDINSNKNI